MAENLSLVMIESEHSRLISLQSTSANNHTNLTSAETRAIINLFAAIT